MQDQLPPAFGRTPPKASTDPVLLRPWLAEDSLDSTTSTQVAPHIILSGSEGSRHTADGSYTLPRVPSIAFGESAAGRPSEEQQGTQSHAIGAVHASAYARSEPVHYVTIKNTEDHGLAFGQQAITDEQINPGTDCRFVTVEPTSLLGVTPQPTRICRDCGRVFMPSLDSSSPTVLRRVFLLLCLACSLLVFQIVDAGGAHVILAHQNPLSKTALSGRVAFIIGQSIGSFVGSAIYWMGRWALLFDLVLGALCAAIAGTSTTYVILDIFRGLTGLTSGICLGLVLLDFRCLLASWVARSIAALLVLILAAAGQIAGGWLSTLIVHSVRWQWLYWGSSIALFCNSCALVFLVGPHKESPHARPLQQTQGGTATVAIVRRSALVVWLPLTHPHLSLATLSMALAACIYVSLLATVHFLWKVTFHFTSHRALLTTTVCLLISSLLALIIDALLGEQQSCKTTKRLTLYDEKSLRAAGCRGVLPEGALFHTAVALLVIGCGLLFLALATKTSVSWVATALLLIIIGTATLLTIDSGLRYIFDIYRPTSDGQGDWGKPYVIAASGSCIGTVFGACAQALMMAPLGESAEPEH